jgi:hypothetical protein
MYHIVQISLVLVRWPFGSMILISAMPLSSLSCWSVAAPSTSLQTMYTCIMPQACRGDMHQARLPA